MKKFLTTVLVIIVAVSLGFGVFYLVRDNEVISLKTASLYKNIHDKFELGLDLEDPNSYTKVEVYSTNEKVLEVKNKNLKIEGKTAVGEFTALQGGVAKIVFKTNNAKFRNVSCDVIVCDGSQSYPFRISTAQDLMAIGTNELYTPNACYELANNIDIGTIIDLNENSWQPIGQVNGTVTPFTGRFDGKGYTIENLKLVGNSLSTGLFAELSSTAKVVNVKFSGAKMIVAGNDTVNVGVVAGKNYGTVERVEVKDVAVANSNPKAVIGGVVGSNISVNNGRVQTIAKLDRVSASVVAGGNDNGEVKGSIQGTFGGVLGKNYGGRVYFSYAVGEINTSDASKINMVGGLVAENEFAKIAEGTNKNYTRDLGASIQECYTNIKISDKVDGKVGYVVGKTTDTTAENALNVISGNYYISTVDGIGGIATKVGNAGTNLDFQAMVSTEAEGNGGNLKDLTSLKSAMVGKKELVVENGEYKIVESEGVVYYWNTNVWEIRVGENNGYPVINMAEQDVVPSLDLNNGEIGSVKNVTEFKDAFKDSLDKTIIVDGDIDFSLIPWEPIGTRNNPFQGRVYVLSGMFKNLRVSGDHEYAGIFGYVGANAVIEGIKVVNAEVEGDYAGIIAGENHGEILNFSVGGDEACTVKAKINGGAVVGQNMGKIRGFNEDSVKHIAGTNLAGEVTNVTVIGTADAAHIGGIAGHNGSDGIITSDAIRRITTSKVTAKPSVDFTSLFVGGVSGYNEGMIENVKVGTSDGKFVVVTNEKIGIATVGGAVGYTKGSIKRVQVIANITASTSEGNYVGGIAGVAHFDDNDKIIEKCNVTNSSLSGYKVGGAVSTLNINYDYNIDAEEKQWFDWLWTWLSNETISVKSVKCSFTKDDKKVTADVVNIDVFEITESTLGGKYTAGAICEHLGGVARNLYISATLTGSTNSGIVHHTTYKSGKGGVITNVVALSTFKGGKSYTTSADKLIHKQAILSSRTCGFVVNYHCQSRKNAEDQGFSVVGSRALKENEMNKSSNWGFLKDNVNWNVTDGEVPTLNF